MPTDLTRYAHQIPPSERTAYDNVKATRKMRWWYEHLADYMIVNPTARQNEIALHFGRAPGTISTIINSDAFKAYLSKRRAEYEGNLDQEVRGKLLNVANKGLDFLLEGLEKKRDTIPIGQLQEVVDKSLKNLGYGVDKSPAVNVNVNQPSPQVSVAVSLEDLDAARMALRASQEAPRPAVIEQPQVEVDFDDE
jgi:hypothetical protein